MHVVREGRSGDGGSPHHKVHGGKKSNWHKMDKGEGKGKEHLKEDLDEKGVKHKAPVSGKHKGIEKKVKKGAY